MQKTGRVGLVFTYLRGQEQLVMEGIFFIVFKDKISRKCQNELHFFITYLGKEMVCWNWEIDMGKKCFLLSSKRVYVQEEIFLISIRNEWKEMNGDKCVKVCEFCSYFLATRFPGSKE